MIQIHHGDCIDVLDNFPEGSAAHCVTDPPYPANFLPVLAECWKRCARVVRTDGFLFVMSGQLHIRSVMQGIESAGWKYCWIGNFQVSHTRTAIWPRGISAAWKPLLIYGRDRLKFKHWTMDTICSDAADASAKKYHEWGQDVGSFRTLLRRFDLTGPILDPFAGSGTTGVACAELGIDFTGIEIDAKNCETAERRINQAWNSMPLLEPSKRVATFAFADLNDSKECVATVNIADRKRVKE